MLSVYRYSRKARKTGYENSLISTISSSLSSNEERKCSHLKEEGKILSVVLDWSQRLPEDFLFKLYTFLFASPSKLGPRVAIIGAEPLRGGAGEGDLV